MTFGEKTWGLRFRLREMSSRSWLVIPCIYVIAALALGRIIPDLVGDGQGPIFGLTLAPDSARGILEAVAGGMITFTGLVVSVAVVVVQFGAGQYTPRLVLRFRRDAVVKHSLGIFIAPALYALVCLGHVKSSTNQESATLSVAVAVILVVAAVIAFFALTARLLDLLRPRRLYDQLRRGAIHSIDDVYPLAWSDDADDLSRLPSGGLPVFYDGPEGVLSALDLARLKEAARSGDSLVEVAWRIGGYVRSGAMLFVIYGDEDRVDREQLFRSAIIAEERTLTQDPAFAIRTIVDIALRALSPAVNDPTTASQALDTLEPILHRLATRNLGTGFVHDDDGTARVAYPAATWVDLLDLSLTEIRHYGADAHQVARRMRSVLLGLLDDCPPPRLAEVERHLALLDAAVLRSYPSDEERAIALTPDHIGLGGRHRLPPESDLGFDSPQAR